MQSRMWNESGRKGREGREGGNECERVTAQPPRIIVGEEMVWMGRGSKDEKRSKMMLRAGEVRCRGRKKWKIREAGERGKQEKFAGSVLRSNAGVEQPRSHGNGGRLSQ